MNNIFSDIPTDFSKEVFEQLAAGSDVKIERIVSKGHASPAEGWYDQPQNEWIIVLKGEARLGFENSPAVTLKTGDYLNIPAHCKHRVEWTKEDEETVWLAVFYS